MIARLSREEFIFQVTLFLLQTFSQEKRKKQTTLYFNIKSALRIINKLGHWKPKTSYLLFLHYKRLNWFHGKQHFPEVNETKKYFLRL